MYYLRVTEREPLTSISVDDVKAYIGISNNDENSLLLTMLMAAVERTERHCNNVFRSASVELVADSDIIYLMGDIVPDSIYVVMADDESTGVSYKRYGNRLMVYAVDAYVLRYNTNEWIPADVKQYILQLVGEMYQRGTEVVTTANPELVNPYKIIAL